VRRQLPAVGQHERAIAELRAVEVDAAAQVQGPIQLGHAVQLTQRLRDAHLDVHVGVGEGAALPHTVGFEAFFQRQTAEFTVDVAGVVHGMPLGLERELRLGFELHQVRHHGLTPQRDTHLHLDGVTSDLQALGEGAALGQPVKVVGIDGVSGVRPVEGSLASYGDIPFHRRLMYTRCQVLWDT
jgi:hypothetical protein